ncbi:MAG: hypothetical protein ACJAVN_001209 [Roseivirga sp.]|jgi:hypothetical protein
MGKRKNSKLLLLRGKEVNEAISKTFTLGDPVGHTSLKITLSYK